MMRVFVFEHMVGGGELHAPLPAGLAAQGEAMLAAAVADLHRAGHEVVSTLDMRAGLALDGATTFTLAPGEDTAAAFDRAARSCEAALIIAPETAGILANWSRRLDHLGVRSLGSSVEAIERCTDKLALHDHLVSHNISTPTTTRQRDALAPPMIAKPRDGAGCEHTLRLHDRADLHELSDDVDWIFQPYHAGRSVSVSLIARDGDVQALQAGEQFIEFEDERVLRYRGGRVPLEAALYERAVALASASARVLPGLRGFVGVDLLLGEREEDDVVIEINPRMTLSFVALVRLCEPPLAAALFDPAVRLQWSPHVLRFDASGRCMVEQVE